MSSHPALALPLDVRETVGSFLRQFANFDKSKEGAGALHVAADILERGWAYRNQFGQVVVEDIHNPEYTRKDRVVSIKKAIVCWKHGSAAIKVVPFPDVSDRSNGYLTYGAGNSEVQHADGITLQRIALGLFVQMVVGYDVPPKAAHEAMLHLMEYRSALRGVVPVLA